MTPTFRRALAATGSMTWKPSSIRASAARVFNPNNFIDVLITMQTTQDAIIGTCYES